MSNRRYRWFLEPLDALTNRALSEVRDANTSMMELRIKGEDNPVVAWEVSRGDVSRFVSSRNSGTPYKFRIFCAEGTGEPREWGFESPNKTRLRRNRTKKKVMKATTRHSR